MQTISYNETVIITVMVRHSKMADVAYKLRKNKLAYTSEKLRPDHDLSPESLSVTCHGVDDIVKLYLSLPRVF